MKLEMILDRYRAPLTALLFCALLLRAMVPAGWMPATGGGLRVELCAEWGGDAVATAQAAEAQQRIDALLAGTRGHGGKSDGDHSNTDQPCAFAGMAMAWMPADLAPMDLPALRPAAFAPAGLAPVRVGEGLAAPPPPATGPPLLA